MVVFIGGGFPRPVYLAHVTSTSDRVTIPSTVVAGNILVYLDYAVASGGPAEVVPTGFTLVSSNLVSSARQILSVKIATNADASQEPVGMNAPTAPFTGNRKILVVLGGGKPTSSISIKSINGEATTGGLTTQTISASGGGVPLLAIAGYGGTGANPSTITARNFTVGGNNAKDWEFSNETGPITCWLAGRSDFYGTTPANISVSSTDSGPTQRHLQSCYIELT